MEKKSNTPKQTNYAQITQHVKSKEEIFVTSTDCVLHAGYHSFRVLYVSTFQNINLIRIYY